jgi:hypothetical protein
MGSQWIRIAFMRILQHTHNIPHIRWMQTKGYRSVHCSIRTQITKKCGMCYQGWYITLAVYVKTRTLFADSHTNPPDNQTYIAGLLFRPFCTDIKLTEPIWLIPKSTSVYFLISVGYKGWLVYSTHVTSRKHSTLPLAFENVSNHCSVN